MIGRRRVSIYSLRRRIQRVGSAVNWADGHPVREVVVRVDVTDGRRGDAKRDSIAFDRCIDLCSIVVARFFSCRVGGLGNASDRDCNDNANQCHHGHQFDEGKPSSGSKFWVGTVHNLFTREDRSVAESIVSMTADASRYHSFT